MKSMDGTDGDLIDEDSPFDRVYDSIDSDDNDAIMTYMMRQLTCTKCDIYLKRQMRESVLLMLMIITNEGEGLVDVDDNNK